MRVLHLLSRLDYGGVETYLMRTLPVVAKSAEVVVSTFGPDQPEMAQRLGQAGVGLRTIADGLRIRSVLDEVRRVRPDVLHLHWGFYSGVVAQAVRSANLAERIVVHAHNTQFSAFGAGPPNLRRRVYFTLARRAIQRSADVRLSCSSLAGKALFGPELPFDVVPYAIGARTRIERNRTLLHVGSFRPQKNHQMLISVVGALGELGAPLPVDLVGAGPLRREIEAHAAAEGVEMRFCGLLEDPYSSGAGGCLVMPSLHEGFGLVVAEAVAAGLPAVVADSFPAEATRVGGGAVDVVSLAAPPSEWAKAVLRALDREVSEDARQEVLREMSPDSAAREMLAAYLG